MKIVSRLKKGGEDNPIEKFSSSACGGRKEGTSSAGDWGKKTPPHLNPTIDRERKSSTCYRSKGDDVPLLYESFGGLGKRKEGKEKHHDLLSISNNTNLYY